MQLNITMLKTCSMTLITAMIATCMGCQPEEFGDGNGLTPDEVSASFTVTPVENKINTYVLKSATDNLIGVKWDLGDGAGASLGKTIDTVFFPDAGVYTIILTAIGKGGKAATASHDLTVTTSDPTSGNLVLGSKMNDEDAASWQSLVYSPGVTFAISNGKMVASGGSGGHAGIYQAIDVVGGKKYTLDMNVSGSGATDVWFEVYVGNTAPVAGTDYSVGGKRLGLNTWGGCGKSAFNGKFSAISCDPKIQGSATVTFDQSGTVYLVIRGGGANLGTDGISIDNVELRGIN